MRLAINAAARSSGLSDGMSALELSDRLQRAHQKVCRDLLSESRDGHWTGELSTSPLSTATAVVALEQMRRGGQSACGGRELSTLIAGGLAWLAEHQNPDGGWGDTLKSLSNISTSMLAHAAFHACDATTEYDAPVSRAQQYIDRTGGVQAVLRRYGKDRTFSIPILTHCAIAGLVPWHSVRALPFELACIPARFYKTVRLPVVSYALPALIAIGQVKYAQDPPRNPLSRVLRAWARRPSRRVLARIQPDNGGFLEATPLTSFVTMSLAAAGLSQHPVARRGLEFIVNSVRPDGSWPIDTNLATWVTTLAVNGLRDALPAAARGPIADWLLDQQYRQVHPYTNADPGGWAWTDLPGGVPDADDTPGALLALLQLTQSAAELPAGVCTALSAAVTWLLDLQNRNGGWPTFCRGWGALPFDRSSADISAHVLRALFAWQQTNAAGSQPVLKRRAEQAVQRGFRYLDRVQRADGAWLPLWFGNQHAEGEQNPVYGTARVAMAYEATGRSQSPVLHRARGWLRENQNPDGGWGGVLGTPSSLEETALAIEGLGADHRDACTLRGMEWLFGQIESDNHRQCTPIGFYFAKLWYFERLYPLTFVVSALGAVLDRSSTAGPGRTACCKATSEIATESK